MMRIPLVFATGNRHKIKEMMPLLKEAGISDKYEIRSLEDIGCTTEIPETADTIRGNAILKAEYINKHYQLNCFAEDTGLIIAALDGEPGVRSARYAGPAKDANQNIDLVLQKMTASVSRSAYFQTVIALILNEQLYCFEGRAEGSITIERRGSGGFGYDPIFLPEGRSLTFAELKEDEKTRISHRYHASRALIDFLAQK